MKRLVTFVLLLVPVALWPQVIGRGDTYQTEVRGAYLNCDYGFSVKMPEGVIGVHSSDRKYDHGFTIELPPEPYVPDTPITIVGVDASRGKGEGRTPEQLLEMLHAPAGTVQSSAPGQSPEKEKQGKMLAPGRGLRKLGTMRAAQVVWFDKTQVHVMISASQSSKGIVQSFNIHASAALASNRQLAELLDELASGFRVFPPTEGECQVASVPPLKGLCSYYPSVRHG